MEEMSLEQMLLQMRSAGVPYPADLDEPLPTPRAAARQSFALAMRDGALIAVDLHLPMLQPGDRAPTCLRSTRYWRATTGSPLKEHLEALEAHRWNAHGFALVLVDARGTGASGGTWDRPWDDAQRDDLAQIVDWIVAQEWSDGTVGGYGTSYDGTTAQLLAATGHPAVRAVVPRFSLFDAYMDISSPGGVAQDGFLQAWAALNWHLDGHPQRATIPPPLPLIGGVRPLDDDRDGSQLAAAQAEHAGNWDLWHSVRDCDERQAPLPDMGMGTPHARLTELRSARVPTWLWSSWYDGAYAAAQLAHLADMDLDVRVTIGPFAHGAGYSPLGDPLQPEATNIPMAEQIRDIATYLRDPDDRVAPNRLRYWRLGDGWREADCWPPDHAQPRRHALRSDGRLGVESDGERRRYDVDFTASTGSVGTRWHTLLGGTPVDYGDRAGADLRLLVWDGPALAAPMGITGSPLVHLDITCDREDFACHVYLEAIRPDGTVLYLTEGLLRASHRAVTEPARDHWTAGPFRTHLPEHRLPVVPGERVTLYLALQPISVLLPAGWRVRVALAGADTPVFRRVPAEGPVRLEVHGSSWIELPEEST